MFATLPAFVAARQPARGYSLPRVALWAIAAWAFKSHGPFLASVLVAIPLQFGQRYPWRTYTLLSRLIIFVGCVCTLLCTENVPYTGRVHCIWPLFWPPWWDMTAIRYYVDRHDVIKSKACEDPASELRVQTALRRLLAAAASGAGGGTYEHVKRYTDVPASVTVLDDTASPYGLPPHVSAFCWLKPSKPSGGGYGKAQVDILRGTLELVGDDDDALAAALAVQLAGRLAKHEEEEKQSRLEPLRLLDALLRPERGATPEHRLAYEADEIAVHLLADAGYDTRGMLRWLERVAEVEARRGAEAGPGAEAEAREQQGARGGAESVGLLDLFTYPSHILEAQWRNKRMRLPVAAHRIARVKQQLAPRCGAAHVM